MDYEQVSLDIIAKLPSQLKAALHESKPSGPVKAEDRDLVKELFKDELYESDQIEHMQLRRRFNDSLLHDESINLADLDEERLKEEAAIDQKALNSNLACIFMDIGPASRELAPQKLKRDLKKPMKAKAVLRVPVTKNVKGHNLIDSEYFDHLYNHHMFHHMLGLSSLKKTLIPTLRELHLPDGFEFEDDEDSFTKDQSYDHSQIM